jgi:primary-amine oxidase
MFSARLDMTVDGVDNAVDEVELERVPVGPDNQHGNAFTRRVTRLARESDGMRTADASVGRAGTWSTRPEPTGSASRSPTRSTRRAPRCSPPTATPP